MSPGPRPGTRRAPTRSHAIEVEKRHLDPVVTGVKNVRLPGPISGTLRALVAIARPAALAFQGWFPDWNHILYSTSAPQRDAPDRLWRVASAGGPSEPISATIDGITRVNAVAVDPAGAALSYTTGAVGTSIWMMEHFLPK